MNDVVIIITSIVGCLLILIFDILMLKKVPRIKFVLWLSGSGLVIYSIIMACLNDNKIALPQWTAWFGWVLFSISILLALYSLFINIPLRKTYISREDNNKVVRTGFYALCRHPGTYWVNLCLISLFLISESTLQLVLAIIIIILNTALVIIEDIYIFPGIFQDYGDYKRNTPMLFPNSKSFRDFINSYSSQRTPVRGNK